VAGAAGAAVGVNSGAGTAPGPLAAREPAGGATAGGIATGAIAACD
jgi:hypothetical protein